MNRDILAVIQENMDSFSKGQKRIANYILESYDKAAFMTASKLGKRVSVSESTVVRFAAELGYDALSLTVNRPGELDATMSAACWESTA